MSTERGQHGLDFGGGRSHGLERFRGLADPHFNIMVQKELGESFRFSSHISQINPRHLVTELSLCERAAWSRLRADKCFRRPRDGKMPNAENPRAWGSGGFRGWLYVLRDWERAVTFERQGGFAAFDFVGPNPAYRYVDEEGRPTVDELNKGAFSYRRMKLALGHLEVTSRPMREW